MIAGLLLIALSFTTVATGLSSVPDAALGLWYLFYSPVLISAISFGMRGAMVGSAIAVFCLAAVIARIDVSLYQTATQVSQALTSPQLSLTDLQSVIQQAGQVPSGSTMPVVSVGDLERFFIGVQGGAEGLGRGGMQLLATT